MVTAIEIIPNEAMVIVSLAKAKKHLRIEASFVDEDDLIQGYVDAAIAASEDFIGGHFLEKDLVIKMDAFESPLIFEAFPLQSITSVKYFPSGGGDEVTMPATDYNLTSAHAKVYNLSFKGTTPQIEDRFDAITVNIKVGQAIGKTPKAVIQAILLQLADMYERREDRACVSATAAMSLLRPYKKY